MQKRHLKEHDIDACLALMELVKDDFAGYKQDEFIKAMKSAIKNKEAFIMCENNYIAGLIAFSYKTGEITLLATSPHYRRRGIAKELIESTKACFKPGDMLHVTTFRDDDPKGAAAVACYQSCGFTSNELLESFGYPCQRMCLWL